MSRLFFAFLLLTGVYAQAQVSVFSCQPNTEVTQTIVNAAGPVIYQQCLEFPNTQTFLFTGPSNKEVRANTSIKIEPGFSAGAYTATGKMKLTIVTDPSALKVVTIYHPNLFTNVHKLEKLELGVELPADVAAKVNNFVNKTGDAQKLNPFLDWQLDVEATFTHPASGTVKVIDGFYYRDYQRDTSINSWTEIPTAYPMRIRFAPPLTGQWLCSVKLKVNNNLYSQTGEFPMTVIESADKGYVTVHQNHRNLQRAGRMIFPVGTNFSTPLKGVNNFGYDQNTTRMTTLENWLTYHQDIIDYQELGGKYIRTLQTGWASLIEFEEKGNYYDRLHYAWEQDKLLEYCEAYDMLMNFNLMEQEPFMKYANYDMHPWDWCRCNNNGDFDLADTYPAYCYSAGPEKEPYKMFLLEDDLKYHEQRTRYYIARYGYSTSIYEFELLSEPYHLNQVAKSNVAGQTVSVTEPFILDAPLGDSVRKALYTYHTRMSSYIKQTLGHTEHLIGINMWDGFRPDGVGQYIDQSIHHPDIDLVTFNSYSSDPTKLVIKKNGSNNSVSYNNDENSFYQKISYYGNLTGKPVLMSEGGSGDVVDGCSNYVQNFIDMMTFGFTGLAGYNAWVGGFPGQEFTWPGNIRAQQHMNGNDVINTLSTGNGGWVQGREIANHHNLPHEDVKTKEQQYYIAQNQELAVGYVKNRTFNVATQRTSTATNTDCYVAFDTWDDLLVTVISHEWNAEKLTVEGLKYNTDYAIDWYSYRTGTYISSDCFSTSLTGKAELHHPTLYVPNAGVLWYVIKQQNCSRGTAADEAQESDSASPVLFQAAQATTENRTEPQPASLEIYPNPMQDALIIKAGHPLGAISLVNNLNQVVYSDFTNSNEITLNTSGLARGTYTLILEGDEKFHKLIKL